MSKLITFLTILLYASGAMSQNWQEIDKELPIPDVGADNQYFGEALDVDGDYAVVGSSGVEGSKGFAYVYFFNGTNWDLQATLKASDGAASDKFGMSVAISGETIVVGAWGNDDVGSNSGSAYVFVKPVAGWVDMYETAKLMASDAAPSDGLGVDVEIDGSVIVCSASSKLIGSYSSAGAVYVYEEPVGGWTNMTETARLIASDGFTLDYLGTSVDISGDNIVAGASGDDNFGSGAGMAYLFTKPVGGWVDGTETAMLYASDAAADDNFGRHVAIDGSVVVIGAKEDDDLGASSGSAYVFEKPGATWVTTTEVAKLNASDGMAGDDFGFGVNISGDVILIGAFLDDGVGGTDIGSAYVFEKPVGGWVSATEDAKLTASDAFTNDQLGIVSLSGNHILVGAKHDDDNGSSSGSVYFYEKPGVNWLTATESSKSSPYYQTASNHKFGASVDVDGDYAVVGATGAASHGEAYVLFYDGSTWSNIATLSPSDGALVDWFGRSVAISGDVIVVGNDRDADNGTNSGSAYVFVKPAGGWINMTETAKLLPSVGFANDYFGYDVDIYGDVIVVGAYGDDEGAGDSGGAFVFEKPGGGWVSMTETCQIAPSDPGNGGEFGRSVSIDVDQIAIGAQGDDNNGVDAGAVYIYTKPGVNWNYMTETAKLLASDGAVSDYLGYSVAISGDNVVAGAYGDDHSLVNAGSAYVWTKPGGGWVSMTETAKLIASDPATSDQFGYGVHIYNDYVIVGNIFDDDLGYSSGSAYFYSKPTGGWVSATEDLKLTASDGTEYDNFGSVVGISNDHIIVGAAAQDEWGTLAGASYLFKKCNNTMNTLTETACDTYTSPSGNYTWTSSGTYVDTIPNTCGSDSVLTINLTINPLDDASFSYSASAFCSSSINETPTVTGLGGGTFTASPGGLTVNSVTGEIDFSTSSTGSYTVTYTTSGTCPNSSDIAISLNMVDTDGDGLSDCDENDLYGTDPLVFDTDGDGLNDGLEVYTSLTDPLDADTDNDGLCDGPSSIGGNCLGGEDLNANGIVDSGETDPLNDDTDSDMCGDATDPYPLTYSPDTDNDGLGNDCDDDDDNDGCLDVVDANPLIASVDTDGDGLSDDCDTDDDNDGVPDSMDDNPVDPQLCQDLDGDGCNDCAGNPTSQTSSLPWGNYSPDPNNDGIDTDGDGMCDFTDVDDDNDGVTDIDEAAYGTDPLNPSQCGDADGDSCDDCSVGTDGFGPMADNDPFNDGLDSDGDGICDSGDSCPYDLINDADNDGYCASDECDDNDPNEFPGQVWYADCDGDGYYSATPIVSCEMPVSSCNDTNAPDGGYTNIAPTNPDCDDEDPNEFPGQVWYADCDGDGFFSSSPITSCEVPSVGQSPCTDGIAPDGGYSHTPGNDCDDEDANVYPGITYYQDQDGDLYGDALSIVTSCTPPVGYVTNNLDCNDTDDSVYPGATEVVDDGIDQDCNGYDAVTCYVDSDQDGFGTNAGTIVIAYDGSCDLAESESAVDTDCNDADNSIYPGAIEIVDDGIDQDCNGYDAVTCYVDSDQDGFGTNAGTTVIAYDGSCDLAENESDVDTDCNDTDNSIYPGAAEVVDDGIDQDCNGFDAVTCYQDSDTDGYGSGIIVVAYDGSCDLAQNESTVDTDCDDTDDQVNPGGTEYGCNGKDDDCNPATLDELMIDVTTQSSGVLIVANNSGADSYQWIDCLNGGQPISGETGQTYLATTDGEYAVIVYEDDCADTSDCVVIGSIGVDELHTLMVSVYPNPARNMFNISSMSAIEYVELIDMQGRLMSVNYSKDYKQIDVSSLEPGRYILRVQLEGKIRVLHVEIIK